MKKIVCGLLLLCVSIKTVSASDEISEQRSPSPLCQTPESDLHDSMYQEEDQNGEEKSQEDKEKKLIDAGLSSFSQALTGCAATSLGYIVTSLAVGEPKLPVLCIFLGGSFPLILKKTGIVSKDLNRTEIVLNGLLLGASLYSVGSFQRPLELQKMSLLGSKRVDDFETSMVKFVTK
jgi:hypothetical protein